jgi:hypothetical protein
MPVAMETMAFSTFSGLREYGEVESDLHLLEGQGDRAVKPKNYRTDGARIKDADEEQRKQHVIAACEEAYDMLYKQDAVDAVELATRRRICWNRINCCMSSIRLI